MEPNINPPLWYIEIRNALVVKQTRGTNKVIYQKSCKIKVYVKPLSEKKDVAVTAGKGGNKLNRYHDEARLIIAQLAIRPITAAIRAIISTLQQFQAAQGATLWETYLRRLRSLRSPPRNLSLPQRDNRATPTPTVERCYKTGENRTGNLLWKVNSLHYQDVWEGGSYINKRKIWWEWFQVGGMEGASLLGVFYCDLTGGESLLPAGC